MYKIFVNEKPIFLINRISESSNSKVYLLETVNIKKVISRLFKDKIQKAYLFHTDKKESMQFLKSELPVTKAGGGMVYNNKDEILFIFRNGKWDLPKGGMEIRETIEETAMREVEEETGVGGLSIVRKIKKTYHVFKRNGRYRLKITHWFEMKTDFTGVLKGQLEEGIEEVAWFSPEEVKVALTNSYENIKLLFEDNNKKDKKNASL